MRGGGWGVGSGVVVVGDPHPVQCCAISMGFAWGGGWHGMGGGWASWTGLGRVGQDWTGLCAYVRMRLMCVYVYRCVYICVCALCGGWSCVTV